MMPTAAFGGLLKEGSPYIRQDAGAKAAATQDLQAAAASLEALKAKLGPESKEAPRESSGPTMNNVPTFKEDPAATFLAYQTMYQCARALTHHAGYRISNFRALLSALQALYVKPGRLDADLVAALAEAQAVKPGTARFAAAAEQWLASAKKVAS